MTLWDKSISLVIDVDKHDEPLVEVDSNSVWDSTSAGPWRYGDNPWLKLKFAEIGTDGTAAFLQQPAGTAVTVVGKERGPNGEMTGSVLFSNTGLSSDGATEEEWSGEIDLFTTELQSALSDYSKLSCRVEVSLTGVYEVSYQFDVTIMEAVNTGEVPTTSAAVEYLTDEEIQALVEGYTDVALGTMIDIHDTKKLVVTANGEIRVVDR